jgi:DNA-binding IclR family transcriptional regulator
MASALKSSASRATQPGSGYSVEAVCRAIQILSAFSLSRPTMTLADIVAATALPKTTSFRILATLVDGGLCERDDASGQYSLGVKTLRLAEICRRNSNLRELSAPVMRQVRDEVGETVVLSVRRGDNRIQVDAAEGLHPLRRIADPGLHAPLYAGAASRVLLAGMSDEEITSYLGRTTLKAIQKNTITRVDELWKEVRRIRQQGYAESSNEVLEGGAALAAPIVGASGATVGVLDIITPESRYTKSRRDAAVRVLLEATRKISGRA